MLTSKSIAATVLAITFLSPQLSKADVVSPLTGKIIVVDAGHGVINFDNRVINPGRESDNGLRENKIDLYIATKLGALLKNEGATVYYTRTWENYWRQGASTVQDNKARAHMANELKADAFLCIHCDWDPSPRVRGVTTLYGKRKSERLALTLHRNMIRQLQVHDRKAVFESYTVLDIAEVPSVIVETGFLSSPSESRKLARSSYQQQVADALAKGLREYFSS